MTSMSLRPLVGVSTEAAQPTANSRAIMSPWVWMAVTCLLLGVSGGIRFWREWKFSSLAVESTACPFPLAELPKSMGMWQATEASEIQLDPEVARFAGASEHIVRTYLDQKTGDRASALALYGLGFMVYLHTPDVCYPSAGYKLFKGPIDRTMEVPGVKGPVRYRWAIYMKRVGGINRYEEVYYTFLHHGDWIPDATDRWKTFRYYPGLFKVQIAHDISTLSEGDDGPCLPLLAEFVRETTARAARAGAGAAPRAGAEPAVALAPPAGAAPATAGDPPVR